MTRFDPAAVREVVAISAQGIGNTVLALPALRDLKRALPRARITVLTPRGDGPQAELFALAEPIDRALPVPATRGLPRFLACLGERPDLTIVTFPHGPASAWLAFLLRGYRVGHVDDGLHRRGRRLFDAPVPIDRAAHDIEQNRALVRALGIATGRDPRCPFRFPDGAVERVRTRLGLRDAPVLAIHAGCSPAFPEKRWAPERFGQVGAALAREAGLRSVVLGGPGEEGLTARVRAAAGEASASGMGLTLVERAALLSDARLFVGNDSGMMNLAVALGVPTVGVFGPSEWARSAPAGDRSRTVRLDLDCSPCWDLSAGSGCVHGTPRCMNELPVAPVLDAARELLALPVEGAG